MKCQILFYSGENKKDITNLLPAELAQRMVNVNSFTATGDNNRLLQTA